MENFKINSLIEMPEPDDNLGDMWQHSFVGTLINNTGDFAIVQDGDGDSFAIEYERLKFAEEE